MSRSNVTSLGREGIAGAVVQKSDVVLAYSSAQSAHARAKRVADDPRSNNEERLKAGEELRHATRMMQDLRERARKGGWEADLDKLAHRVAGNQAPRDLAHLRQQTQAEPRKASDVFRRMMASPPAHATAQAHSAQAAHAPSAAPQSAVPSLAADITPVVQAAPVARVQGKGIGAELLRGANVAGAVAVQALGTYLYLRMTSGNQPLGGR